MSSLNPDSEAKQELDDSGYVQEDVTKCAEYKGSTELLQLSDDVLLYILQHCSPMDLKALGFTCTRLASLILDRSLWLRIDARSSPCGPARVRWFLTHGVNSNTRALLLSGCARDADKCLDLAMGAKQRLDDCCPTTSHNNGDVKPNEIRQNISRRFAVTVGRAAMKHLTSLCPNLEELALDFCIIDCAQIKVSMFPRRLKKLSLKGSKCFHLDKSFLFQIQDYLTELEELDFSYCEWMDPSCILPLSKLPKLTTLNLRECLKLSEFVAYASLASRYGFKTLRKIDLRGCPVGDSEVSALGWVPHLEELQLSRAMPRTEYIQSIPDHPVEIEPWEEQEPDFFKNKAADVDWYDEDAQIDSKKLFKSRFDIYGVPSCPELLRFSEVYDNLISYSPRNRAQNQPTGVIIANPTRRRDENGNEPNNNDDQEDHNGLAGPSNRNDKTENDHNDGNNTVHNGVAGPSNQNENGNVDMDDEPPSRKNKYDDSYKGDNLPSDANKSSRYSNDDHSSSDSDDNDDGRPKCKKTRLNAPIIKPVMSQNENSTKVDENPSTSTCKNSQDSSNCPKTQRYVRFRQNQPPMVIEQVQNVPNEPNQESNNDIPEAEPGPSNENQEPKHQVLVVNLGRRRHAMYRLSLPVCTLVAQTGNDFQPADLRPNGIEFRPWCRNVSSFINPEGMYQPQASRLDPGALITDSAIQRFGRADYLGDSERPAFIRIGPNGPEWVRSHELYGRPDRSSLRRLSVVGYRHITNSSLVHLATAAPHLEFLDLTGTGVTEDGVEQFKSHRPDVKVIHCPFEKKKQEPS